MNRLLYIIAVGLLAAGCNKGKNHEQKDSAREIKAGESFEDEGLVISVKEIAKTDSGLVLAIKVANRHAGKVHYLPSWDEHPEPARITDEYRNVFYAAGARDHPLRPPLNRQWYGTFSGNRIDPNKSGDLFIPLDDIPPSSKRLRVELPYGGRTLVFVDVPRR
ncbi:hypothetical protein GobsT_63850 [Gemmata obscuriglobus]|uniref:Uncharacterized protein n=1 Tax=Gemmata obscuriglobus TaxID=114 RepID=A0A2Z3H2Q1_9BACT|nr:hypothetical protein [Gemmata obscuriglobus]AWM35884.1 hypothetical protein C1280_01890 [Gemmata obscuriglobus]QEG31563.1 hypothetical protein GobsT_63850 [Gemmata obscuriglobus]VTS10905.1 unnamed protein product [Gemmata obscuriglobus UQM 2246]